MNKILSITFILAIVLVLSKASKLRQTTWDCQYSHLKYKTKGFSLKFHCTSSEGESVKSLVYFSRCKKTPNYLKDLNSSCNQSEKSIKCNEGDVDINSILKFSSKKRKLVCKK